MRVRGFFVVLATAWALPLSAEQLATTSDGRTVRLFDDGRWEYVTDAVRKDSVGEVRKVTPDGVSDRTGESLAHSAPARLPAASGRVTLDKVEILRREKRRAKTRNIATRTVFHLTVENTSAVTLRLDEYMSSRFKAVSSTGATFPVIDLDYEGDAIAPGGQRALLITVENSPQWPMAQHVTLEIAPQTFGNPDRYVLQTAMSDIRTREVDRFPQQ